jgi:hypothetical protein
LASRRGLVKDRDQARRRVALEEASMTVDLDDRVRRGRPPLGTDLPGGRLGDLTDILAAEHGTPFYAYDLDVMSRQAEALRAVLPPVADVAYAVKANPALAVVAHLGDLGLGADVASAELAREGGISSSGS